MINRFVVQSAKVPRYKSQLINSPQLHRATSLCIQLLDKENNGVNDKLLSGLRLCFRIVRGYIEISVSLFKRKCCNFIEGFMFHLENVPRHRVPLINLKLYKFNQFPNISYD